MLFPPHRAVLRRKWPVRMAPTPSPPSQLTLLRTFPQRSRFYLGIAEGKTLYFSVIEVAEIIPTNPAVEMDPPFANCILLTYENVASKVVHHSDEVWIGNSEETYDVGIVEPVGSSATNTTIKIYPTSLSIPADFVGKHITVRRQNRFWIHPWKEVGKAYEYYLPVPCMGPPRLGFVDEVMTFDASPSWARYGKTITDWDWDWDDGNIANTAQAEHSWDTPGEYWIKLKVTDSGGKEGIAYRPVLIYNRPPKPTVPAAGTIYPIMEFEVVGCGASWSVGQGGNLQGAARNDLRGDVAGDWSLSIRILEDCSIEEFPNWASLVIMAEDWYGDTQAAIWDTVGQRMGGLAYAEEVVYAGWLLESSVRRNVATEGVTFKVESIEGLMSRSKFYGTYNFRRRGSGWHSWPAHLTLEKILCHMAETQSTLKFIVDLYKPLSLSPDGNDEEGRGAWFVYFDLSGTLLDMFDMQLAAAFGAHFMSSRFGTCHLEPNVQLLPSYSPDPAMTFIKRDWFGDIEIRERLWGQVSQVTMICYNGYLARMEVRYPTNPKSYGTIDTVEGLLFVNRGLAEEWLVRYLSWRNLRFPSVTLKTINNRLLEPALQPVVTVTLALEDTLRKVEWDAKEFIVRAAGFEIKNEGWMTVNLALEEKRA